MKENSWRDPISCSTSLFALKTRDISQDSEFYLFRVKFIGVTLKICMNSHVLREASGLLLVSQDRSQMAASRKSSLGLKAFRKSSRARSRIWAVCNMISISTGGRDQTLERDCAKTYLFKVCDERKVSFGTTLECVINHISLLVRRQKSFCNKADAKQTP